MQRAGMHPGKVMIPHIERSPRDTPSVEGDTPAAGARNLGDQTVSAGAAQDAADSGARLFGISPTLSPMGRGRQPNADIPVVETAAAAVAVHNGVGARERLEAGTTI